jgi:hypothetical protein
VNRNPKLALAPEDEELAPQSVATAVQVTVGEQLERLAVVALARLSDSKILVPIAAAGHSAERSVRRLRDRTLTTVYHLYQLPTREEVLVLREQVSALRHRVGQLEQATGSGTTTSKRPRR